MPQVPQSACHSCRYPVCIAFYENNFPENKKVRFCAKIVVHKLVVAFFQSAS